MLIPRDYANRKSSSIMIRIFIEITSRKKIFTQTVSGISYEKISYNGLDNVNNARSRISANNFQVKQRFVYKKVTDTSFHSGSVNR